MSYEPKTKAGKILMEAFDKIDEFIESKTDDPAEKEVAAMLTAKLKMFIKSTPTKIDDILGMAILSYLENRYKI